VDDFVTRLALYDLYLRKLHLIDGFTGRMAYPNWDGWSDQFRNDASLYATRVANRFEPVELIL
jgi:hypothetical protein